jgi:hypothetical protein
LLVPRAADRREFGRGPDARRRIGGAIGAGIQSEGVLAVAKHYVANNFEWLRTGEGNATPVGRYRHTDFEPPLHEIYSNRSDGRWSVRRRRAAWPYNRLNGHWLP